MAAAAKGVAVAPVVVRIAALVLFSTPGSSGARAALLLTLGSCYYINNGAPIINTGRQGYIFVKLKRESSERKDKILTGRSPQSPTACWRPHSKRQNVNTIITGN